MKIFAPRVYTPPVCKSRLSKIENASKKWRRGLSKTLLSQEQDEISDGEHIPGDDNSSLSSFAASAAPASFSEENPPPPAPATIDQTDDFSSSTLRHSNVSMGTMGERVAPRELQRIQPQDCNILRWLFSGDSRRAPSLGPVIQRTLLFVQSQLGGREEVRGMAST